MKNEYHNYKSIEDFLISHPLNIDAELDDGWGAFFPVKGIELDATILFADITSFSSRTKTLSPVETLLFVNNFFAWMSAEGLHKSYGLIDKYIGDEMMIVFANEFGSENHFEDALRCARGMIERDVLNYCPHIGAGLTHQIAEVPCFTG
jgi:class 3 adenylate cyclase